MKNLITLSALCILFNTVFSQQIKPSAFTSGGSSYNTNPKLSISIGQSFGNTISGAGSIITQGILQPAIIVDTLSAEAVVSNLTCYNVANGAINLTVSGGTPPYTFIWSNLTTTEDLNNIGAGTYYVTVSDNSGQTVIDTFEITEPSEILSSQTFVECAGFSITVGTNTYNATGVYTDVLIGSNGCDSTVTTNLTIKQPTTSSQTFVECAGFSVIVGTNTYNATGIYTDVFTGSNGCDSTVTTDLTINPIYNISNNASICNGESYLLPDDSVVSVQGTYTTSLLSFNNCDSIIVTNLTVNDIPQTSAITGSLTVIENEIKQYSVTNNTGSSYEWISSNGTLAGGQGTNTVFVQWGNTGIGSLQVIETNNGCSGDTVSITVTIGNVIPCDSLQVSVTGQNIICNGQCNGAASVQVVVGNPPYTYIWNDAYYQQTSSISNLCTGSYSVTVFDYYNCTTSGTYTVTQPDELALNISTTPASCGQNNGSASATVTGGTQPYTYAWTSGSLLSTADSLTAGVYMLTVTDANSCSKFTIANISNSTGPTITANNVTDLTCYNSQNGAINITVSGGSTPYAFSWTTGATTEDIANLQSGPYEVEITDTSGCMATASYFVTQPNQLNAVATTFPATCGNTNGAATITVTGGSQSYSYVWSNGSTNSTVANLAPGTYTVSVSDSQYCTATPVMVNINTTGGPIITVDSILQTGCSGSDGAIYTSVSGGTSPYTYLWSNGATTSNLYSLTSNFYSLTLTDANSCIAATSVEITSVVPSVPQICIVTVDSTEHKNLIVWEKEITSNIAYYNIYREGSWAGYYFLAGSVNYDDYSQFLDVNSNPKMRAYRYKITAVDQCGNESSASTPHKTIHLAINDGIGNSWNLIWTEYEGFNFPGYYIYRHINSEGWTLIDSIATGYNSYTDIPPSQGQLSYLIAINSPQICTPTGNSKTQSGPYSQSISNIDEYGIWINVNSVANNKAALNVYPNPTDGKFYISINGLHGEATLNIFDVTGKLVFTEILTKETTLKQVDFSTLPMGIYAVKVTSGDVVKVSRIVVQ